MLLHGALLHLAFNLIALAQVGPAVEGLFGWGRTLFLFVATGIAAKRIGMVQTMPIRLLAKPSPHVTG